MNKIMFPLGKFQQLFSLLFIIVFWWGNFGCMTCKRYSLKLSSFNPHWKCSCSCQSVRYLSAFYDSYQWHFQDPSSCGMALGKPKLTKLVIPKSSCLVSLSQQLLWLRQEVLKGFLHWKSPLTAHLALRCNLLHTGGMNSRNISLHPHFKKLTILLS